MTEKKLKSHTESVRAVPGVCTTVLGLSALSCFSLHFDKNNLRQEREGNGEWNRGALVANSHGDRTALGYKLE